MKDDVYRDKLKDLRIKHSADDNAIANAIAKDSDLLIKTYEVARLATSFGSSERNISIVKNDLKKLSNLGSELYPLTNQIVNSKKEYDPILYALLHRLIWIEFEGTEYEKNIMDYLID